MDEYTSLNLEPIELTTQELSEPKQGCTPNRFASMHQKFCTRTLDFKPTEEKFKDELNVIDNLNDIETSSMESYGVNGTDASNYSSAERGDRSPILQPRNENLKSFAIKGRDILPAEYFEQMDRVKHRLRREPTLEINADSSNAVESMTFQRPVPMNVPTPDPTEVKAKATSSVRDPTKMVSQTIKPSTKKSDQSTTTSSFIRPFQNKRGRVRIACGSCHRNKIKCDNGRPCGPCKKNGFTDCRNFIPYNQLPQDQAKNNRGAPTSEPSSNPSCSNEFVTYWLCKANCHPNPQYYKFCGKCGIQRSVRRLDRAIR